MADSPQFNDLAKAALELARDECADLRLSHVGTEHILLGLLRVDDGAAAGGLVSCGVGLEALRLRVAEAVGTGQQDPPNSIPYTPRARKVIELARREALQLGHSYAGTEHLLLGLLREGEGIAIQVLSREGADLEGLRRLVSGSLARKDGGPGPRGDDALPDGYPRRSARYFAGYPASSATARVFRCAAEESRQPAITTMDLLAAVEAMDWADWQRFFIASAQPPQEWSPRASDESAHPPMELWIGQDSCYTVTRAAYLVVRMADRLAAALDRSYGGAAGERVMVPGHLVFGMLAVPSCDAFRWMTEASAMSGQELRSLLGDRVFGSDQPKVSINDPLPDHGWKNQSGGASYGPPWDESVQEAASRAARTGGALSTLDFLSDMRETRPLAWQALHDTGYRLQPPEGKARRESDENASEYALGPESGTVRVTQQAKAAFAVARALAFYRGDAAVTAAHVLYGIFDEPTNDGSRWLARPDPDPGPRQVLADKVFCEPLPPRRLLKAAPPARRSRVRVKKALVLGTSVIWAFPFMIRLLFSAFVLVAVGIGVYVAYPLVFPPPTSARLASSISLIEASVSYGGAEFPATLVGRLSDYYSPSAAAAGPEPGLSQWLAFATRVPPRAPAQSAVRITYRGRAYPATLYCPGWLHHYLCLTEARMPQVSLRVPGLRIPIEFRWQAWGLPAGPAAPAAFGAYILAIKRGVTKVETAEVTQAGTLSIGLPAYAAEEAGGAPPASASPVVINGGAPGMNLVGIATMQRQGPRVIVMPAEALFYYLSDLAGMQAQLLPTATADAWLVITAPPSAADHGPGVRVSAVSIGGAADMAGIQVGDRIVSMAGISVSSLNDFDRVIARFRPYQTINVVFYRGRRKLACQMRLGYARNLCPRFPSARGAKSIIVTAPPVISASPISPSRSNWTSHVSVFLFFLDLRSESSASAPFDLTIAARTRPHACTAFSTPLERVPLRAAAAALSPRAAAAPMIPPPAQFTTSATNWPSSVSAPRSS